MKKFILISFIFSANLTFAQDCITFDARFIDCLNKWVILPQNDDLPFNFGYVFLDAEFNIIFQKEGTFEVGEECNYYPTKSKQGTKTKLAPSNILVSVVPDNRFSELGVSATPDWYKPKKWKENAETYFNFGYLYNEWGECRKALKFLKQAEELNSKVTGLEKELAFAYNSLAKYDKALEILQLLREKYPKDAYIYRELIFALVKLGQIKEAEYNLKHSLKVCKDKKYNGENCLNLMYQYFKCQDKKKFYQWLRKSKNLNKGNKKALELIKKMENELKK
jgi:predicted Zn-dependent protease